MSQKSDNLCHNSSQTHSSKRNHSDSDLQDREPIGDNQSKRKRSITSTTTITVVEVKVESPEVEQMEGFAIGRGRGRFRQKMGQIGTNSRLESDSEPNGDRNPSPPKQSNVGPKTPPKAPVVVDKEQELKDQRIKKAEARSGLTMDLLNSFLNWNPTVANTAATVDPPVDQKPLFQPRSNNWFTEKKEEIELNFDASDQKDIRKEKKFLGKQYVNEVQQKERERMIKSQKDEIEGKASTSGVSSIRGQSPGASQEPQYRRHANRKQNPIQASTHSVNTSVSTDLESVGTYQVLSQDRRGIPDPIQEEEDITPLIEQYFKTKPKRTELPITSYEERILDAVLVNRVVVIEGQTGCGKTTQVPQFLADDCAAKGLPFNIVVTQPRRIAAKSIATRVAQERGWQLGSIVGYQIGMDRANVNDDTRLLYCTTGVLLQRLIHTQRLDCYSHIIIDEVHERSIETDLLLLVIKKLMNVRSHSVKIILMSATFDPERLIEYFTIPIVDSGDVVNEVRPTHVLVLEKPHRLNKFYMTRIKTELGIQLMAASDVRLRTSADVFDKDAPCLSNEAVEVAIAIIETGIPKIEGIHASNRGSVLVFLPGLEEIHELKARLEMSEHCHRQQWKIYPLHSSVPLDKQNAIFYRSKGNERKIILATNIAESSITVPDVSYVIDFCLTKNLVCDIETHIPVLRMEWASKANCEQRAGRAGRVSEGRVYRLVEESFYNRLQPFSQPELVRSPLDLSILRVKMLDMDSPKELLGLALDPPDLSDIYHSVLQLKQCGAFTIMTTNRPSNQLYYDEEDGDITTLGIIMSALPIDIRLGKLIVMGHVFDVLESCIIMAACLSTQGMFRKDFSQGLNAYKSRMAWADRSFSDGIAYLNAYKMYKRFDEEFKENKAMAEKWCKQNHIQHKRILEVDYMIGELMDRLRRENILVPIRPNLRRNRHEEELILKVVMCASFYPNYFTRNEIDLKEIPKMLSTRDPLNSVAIHGLPMNEGPLYTNAIRAMITPCSQRIDLNFEDTKAFITFIDDKHPLTEAFDLHIPAELKIEAMSGTSSSMSMTSNSTVKYEGRDTPMSTNSLNSSRSNNYQIKRGLKETTIKTAVYVAVAMRQHREVNKEFPKLHPDEARKRLEKFEKVKQEEEDKWKSFRSNRICVPHILPRIKLTKLMLPAFDCSEMEIRVTHIENPTEFWAQYAHTITSESLEELSNLITYELNTVPCSSETVLFGDLVIAKYADPKGSLMFGRARIVNIDYKFNTKEVDKVQVFFIDYGFTRTFDNISELSEINARTTHRLMEIAPQAFRCSLSRVNPSPISCHDSCWSKKSIEHFKTWTKKKDTFTAKIYSVVNRIVKLELFDNVDRGESLNDLLVGIGFAEKWEEDAQSRLNHDQRRTIQLTRDESLGPLRLEKVNQKHVFYPDDVIELEIDFNPIERGHNIRTHEKIQIKGPFSPLECSFTGLCHQSSNRSVRIERDSVNSVVLEADYLSKHTRLLVASSVGLSQNTGGITLRDTTLMPNIRGFPALMALLFAPRVQLRADKEKQQYVGAICGIGYDRRTMKGYDPEYDAEICFDSDISLNDMIKVNIIRYHISSLIKTRETLREYVEGSLAVKQRKVRRLVIELLDRRRRLLDSSTYFPNYKWSDISKDDINSSLNKSEAELNAELLPTCEQIRLTDFDWFKTVADNLQILKEVEAGSFSTTTKCILCNFKAYTRHDITSHLTSNEHRDAVIDFNKDFKIEEQEKQKQEYYSRMEGEEEQIQIFDLDSEDE